MQKQFRPEPDSLTNRFATVAREFVLPPGWWPVAFSAKVGRHPGAFVLAGRRLALYRDVSGTVRAVDDVCPHRRMPLSMGRVTEDGYLQCAYHGWCFDGATGQCAAIPHLREDEPVKANQGVASLATAETLADVVLEEGMSMLTAHTRGGYVHVWVGDGDPVDPPAVPAPGSSRRRGFPGTVKVRAPYDVLAEELLWNSGRVLGLPLLLGSGDELVRPKVSIDGDTVTVRRERLTLNLPRVQTFSAVNQGSTVTETSMNVVTGFASITAREPGGRVVSTVSIGLTPISPYLTALRWRAAVRATLRGRVGQATALHWLPARAARTAHASLDGRVGRHDEGIDAFRRSRAMRLEPATEFRAGGVL